MKFLFTCAAVLVLAIEAWAAPPSKASYLQSETVFPQVIMPALPAKLDLAGESVPLQYYDVRESLQRELLVTIYMHSRTMQTLLNAPRYFPVIEPILARNGIPSDFKYLCMAESGLQPNVVSPAKAAGLWQIMPGTGKDYGLVVGSEVDERYDIEKATEVACKHLRDSYDIFGSWTLAAAAYNLGNEGVKKRIERQGVVNYYDSYFPAETMRYVFRILAFKMLTENPAAYGYQIRECDYYTPLTDYTVIEVGGAVIDWSEVALRHGTTYKMLRELNHWIRDYGYNNRAGKTFQVRIPGRDFRKAK